jgi:D-sedoheptulose 7-phosphate isomerase
MESSIFLEELIGRHPRLAPVKEQIGKAAASMILCYQQGRKVLVCGNGGSSSDADHIVGELMKGFERKRPVGDSLKKRLAEVAGDRGRFLSEKLQKGLPAISLAAHHALLTAVANDTDAALVFAQQVAGYGKPGDVLIGISSSGNSQNVMDAMITAKAMGMTVIALTGETGGKMKSFADILINVPGIRTAYVQELHLPVYHTLCQIVEYAFFSNSD